MSAATHPQQSLRRDAQIIGLVGLAHGTSHFFQLILAPLFPWLKAAFGLTYAELGLLMSVFFVVSGVGQALAGFVVDRAGAWIVLVAGIGLLAVSALGFAASHSYPMLILFAGIAGLGNSVFHPADFTILNRRVSVPRLGHAFGMHGILGTFGWASAPVFMAGLATLLGWRSALLCAGLLAFAILALLVANRALLDTREMHAARRAGQGRRARTLARLPAPAGRLDVLRVLFHHRFVLWRDSELRALRPGRAVRHPVCARHDLDHRFHARQRRWNGCRRIPGCPHQPS